MAETPAPFTAETVVPCLLKWVPQSRRSRQFREPRWAQVRDMFYDDFDGAGEGERPSQPAVSLVRVKGSKVCNDVVGAVTSSTPYVVVEPYDGSSSPNRNHAVQVVLEASGLAAKLRGAAQGAYWANFGVVHCRWVKDPVGRLDIAVCDPFDVLVWPPFKPMSEADMVVRQIERTREEVESLIEAGVYLEGPVTGEQGTDHKVVSGPSTPASAQSNEDSVKLWWGVVRRPGTKAWSDVTFSDDGSRVYRFEAYPFEALPFAQGRMMADRPTDGAYPSVSRGSDLQNVQVIATELSAIVLAGMKRRAQPPLATNDAKLAKKLGAGLSANEVVLCDDPLSIRELPGDADVPGAFQGMEFWMGFADQAGGASAMGSGGREPGVNTATAIRGIEAGEASSMDAAIAAFGDLPVDVAFIADEFMRKDADKKWVQDYFGTPGAPSPNAQMPPTPQGDKPQFDAEAWLMECSKAAVFRAAVTADSGTPERQMQALDGMAGMAAQVGYPLDYHVYFKKRAELLKARGIDVPDEMLGDPLTNAVDTIAAKTGLPPELVANTLGALVQQYMAAAQSAGAMGGPGMAGQPGHGMGGPPPQGAQGPSGRPAGPMPGPQAFGGAPGQNAGY